MRRAMAMCAAGLMLIGGLGACSKKATTTTSSPAAQPTTAETKADYIARGNAVCDTFTQKQSALPTPSGSALADVAPYIDQNVTLATDLLAQLKAIPQPAGDSAALQDVFTKFQATLDLLKQEAAAAHANNQSTFDTLDTQLNTSGDASNAAFNAYGLTVCGAS